MGMTQTEITEMFYDGLNELRIEHNNFIRLILDERKVQEDKWHYRFLDLARLVATWSKDPSRQVGAVLVDSDRSIISTGYNGFARGVDDLPERYAEKAIKYELVVHAEVNAILSSHGRSLSNATLYSTLMPCSRCAGLIINAGIKRVVTVQEAGTHDNSAHHMDLATQCFQEAGVELVTLPLSQ